MIFNKTPKTVAIIDIGSSSVGCAIVSFDLPHKTPTNQSCPNIHWSNRKPAQILPGNNFPTFNKTIMETMDQAVSELKKQSQQIDRVMVFLPSPYCVSHTNIIRKKGDEPFTITNKLINSLLSKQDQKIRQDYPVLYSDLAEDTTVALENKVMQIRLNGYETSNFVGQKALDMFMAVYTSVGSQKILDQFTEIITRHLGKRPIDFHSFTLSAFSIFRDLTPIKSSFLLLDVTGELTDIAVVTDGYISTNTSFPLGKNFIIRKMAEALGTNSTEAYSRLKEYSSGNLNETGQTKIESALNSLRPIWIASLSQALSSAMQSVLLPENIYMIGDDIICKIFAEWVKDQELIKFSLASRPLSANLINTESLNKYCANNSDQRYDPFFQIEALFCQKIL